MLIGARTAVLALALCASLGTAPALSSPPNVPFVLTRLELDLTVDYARGTVGGTATLTMRNVSGHPATTVPLLLNRLMSVSRVRSSTGATVPFGQRVGIFADDRTRQVAAITVTPPRPLADGDSITLAIEYGGVLVGYVETGSLYIQDHVDSAFTIIRTDAYAFPELGVLSDAANRAAQRGSFTFKARVTVPNGQIVAMGGEQTYRSRSDPTTTFEYRGAAPVSFLNIAIAPYRILERPAARIFYFADDSAGARVVDGAIGQAMDSLTAWFGPLSTVQQLAVMEIPNGFGSQASLAAGVLQTAAAFHDKGELRQLYHELSHIWNVEDRERPSPRWNEGLASFLQFRMAASLDDWKNWSGILDRATKRLHEDCSATVRCDSVPFADYGRARMTDESYTVGLLMFYALYETMGAERFDRAYRDFYQKYRATGATTAQMAESFRGADPGAGAVLDDWLCTARWYSRLTAGETVAQMVERYRKH